MRPALLPVLLLVGCVFTGDVAAQAASSLPHLVDRTRLVAGVDSFVVLVQGRQLGWQRHARSAQASGWEVRDAITLTGMVEQESIVTLDDRADERSLRQQGTMRGKSMTIMLDFTANAGVTRVTGTADTPSNATGAIRIDTVVPAGTVDDNAVSPLLLAVPWRGAMHVAVPLMSSGKGTVSLTSLKVIDSLTVTVPAGTFAVWRVEQQTEGARVHFDVTREAPFRLVRMQQVGTPLEIVLVGSRATSPTPR